MVIRRQLRVTPFHLVSIPGIVMMASTPGFAMVYLTVEQAQQLIFPEETFTYAPLALSEQQLEAVHNKSGVPVRRKEEKIWQTSRGGYLIVDEVIGKHELITYAVGIDPDGSVRQVEILEYREAYGSEVRQRKWRKQFVGKTAGSPLKLKEDIKNITGATLSCRHVTDGVKRLLSLYELVLKK